MLIKIKLHKFQYSIYHSLNVNGAPTNKAVSTINIKCEYGY